MTVHPHALRALKVSYSDIGEGGVAVNCEKIKSFLNSRTENCERRNLVSMGIRSKTKSLADVVCQFDFVQFRDIKPQRR